MKYQDHREGSESSAESNTYSFKCPNCGRDLESSASPFGDGGDFFWCECNVEGYGYYDPQDGHWELSFTIYGGTHAEGEPEQQKVKEV
jgi:ssDNA-binding Zn-finger/Zn-ribbon topoisomerase 1